MPRCTTLTNILQDAGLAVDAMVAGEWVLIGTGGMARSPVGWLVLRYVCLFLVGLQNKLVGWLIDS